MKWKKKKIKIKQPIKVMIISGQEHAKRTKKRWINIAILLKIKEKKTES